VATALILLALLPAVTACGANLKTQGSAATPAPSVAVHSAITQAPATAPAAPVEDPVLTLIASSDSAFKAGQKELEQGHFEAAKQEFNRAVDILLESPYGARTEPRIREHFDRLVDRISIYEPRAGHGRRLHREEFTSRVYRRAAMSATLGTPPAAPGLRTRSSRTCSSGPTTPDSAEPAGACAYRAVPGAPPRLHRRRMKRGSSGRR
jgi:hypothetical protein